MPQFLRSHRWYRLWWPVLALVLYAQGVALVHALEHRPALAALSAQAAFDQAQDSFESAGIAGGHDHDLDDWGHSAGSAQCQLFDQVVSVLGCAADAPDVSHAINPTRPCPGPTARLAAACVCEHYLARAPPAA